MKKSELVELVAEKAELTKTDANKAVDAVFAAITEGLKKEGRVPIVGFGTFNVAKRAARVGRNPRTGEEVKIPARNAVTFKPGTALKDSVN